MPEDKGTNMDQEVKDRVSAIVRDTLARRFKDEFKFEPIAVVEDIDEFIDDEQEYMKIIIVFDGDPARLDVRLRQAHPPATHGSRCAADANPLIR